MKSFGLRLLLGFAACSLMACGDSGSDNTPSGDSSDTSTTSDPSDASDSSDPSDGTDPTDTSGGTCVDTANGATDVDGDGCAAYDFDPSYCGNFDDDDFSSNEMCCACGGGETTSGTNNGEGSSTSDPADPSDEEIVVPTPDAVKSVYAFNEAAFALKWNGDLVRWGGHSQGGNECGSTTVHSNFSRRNREEWCFNPTSSLDNIKTLESLARLKIALKNDGSLVFWGYDPGNVLTRIPDRLLTGGNAAIEKVSPLYADQSLVLITRDSGDQWFLYLRKTFESSVWDFVELEPGTQLIKHLPMQRLQEHPDGAWEGYWRSYHSVETTTGQVRWHDSPCPEFSATLTKPCPGEANLEPLNEAVYAQPLAEQFAIGPTTPEDITIHHSFISDRELSPGFAYSDSNDRVYLPVGYQNGCPPDATLGCDGDCVPLPANLDLGAVESIGLPNMLVVGGNQYFWGNPQRNHIPECHSPNSGSSHVIPMSTIAYYNNNIRDYEYDKWAIEDGTLILNGDYALPSEYDGQIVDVIEPIEDYWVHNNGIWYFSLAGGSTLVLNTDDYGDPLISLGDFTDQFEFPIGNQNSSTMYEYPDTVAFSNHNHNTQFAIFENSALLCNEGRCNAPGNTGFRDVAFTPLGMLVALDTQGTVHMLYATSSASLQSDSRLSGDIVRLGPYGGYTTEGGWVNYGGRDFERYMIPPDSIKPYLDRGVKSVTEAEGSMIALLRDGSLTVWGKTYSHTTAFSDFPNVADQLGGNYPITNADDGSGSTAVDGVGEDGFPMVCDYSGSEFQYEVICAHAGFGAQENEYNCRSIEALDPGTCSCCN